MGGDAYGLLLEKWQELDDSRLGWLRGVGGDIDAGESGLRKI